MRKFLTVGVIAFSLLMTSVVNAQVTSSRPGFTEDTETVDKGVIQLEGGYTFFKSGPAKTHTFGEVLVRHGLSKNVELRVAGNSYQVTRNAGPRTSGLQDAAVGVKLNLRRGTTELLKPRVAVLLNTTVPTGARVYSNNYQPGVSAALSWDLAESTVLNTSLGYRRADGGAARFNQVSGGAQVYHQANTKYGFYGEVFDVNSPGFGGSSKYVGTGVTYKLSSDVTLDATGGYGLNGRQTDYYVGFGATKRF